EEEDRHGDPQQRAEDARVVQPAAATAGGQVAEGDRRDQGEVDGHEAEFDRGREPLREHLQGGHARGDPDGVAEVTGQRPAEEGEVLDEDRLVEPEFLTQLSAALRRAAVAEEGRDRPSRKRPQPGEEQHRENEQNEYELQYSTKRVTEHWLATTPR